VGLEGGAEEGEKCVRQGHGRGNDCMMNDASISGFGCWPHDFLGGDREL